jgi:hypothetical protein
MVGSSAMTAAIHIFLWARIHTFHFNVLQLNFHLYLKVLQNVVQCIGINTRLVLTLVLKWFSLVCSNTSYQRLVKCKHVRSITLHVCWIPASWLKPHKRPCELHGPFCTTDTWYFGCTLTHCKHALSKKNYFWIDNSVHYWIPKGTTSNTSFLRPSLEEEVFMAVVLKSSVALWYEASNIPL